MPKDREMSLDELIDNLMGTKREFGGDIPVRIKSTRRRCPHCEEEIGKPEHDPQGVAILTHNKRRILEIS